MGAMLKVMQKMKAKADDNDGAPAAPADPENTAAPDANVTTPADETASNPETTAFISEPSLSAKISAATISDDTIEWNADKLDPAVVAFHERYSAVTEQYRSLRARLTNMNPEQKHQVIAITSSLPQEGKSVTTLNLGMVMAEGGEHRILIADADFRRASIAKMLGISQKPGLAELIRGTAEYSEAVRPTHLPNLKVLTAGATKEKDYGDLVGGSAARNVLANLSVQFDYVFLDMPPVNTVSDVSMLAPHCHGALLVIEMRRTPEPVVQEAVRTLQTTNVKILGCLLSRHKRERGHYYERYYSYYYNRE